MTIHAFQSNVVRLDARVYGTDGYLPGVAQDQQKWFRHLTRIGADIRSETNTTVDQFSNAISQLAQSAMPGDLVIIQHSGHGTWQRDQNGDEEDGRDEVLCFHDNTLLDDAVWRLLLLFRTGVNVLFIIDTCHSGTGFRSLFPRLETRVLDPTELNCSLVAIGTCNDQQTAADTPDGGAGTQALLATWNLASDYRGWALKAQNWLARNRFRQELTLSEVNADLFAAQKPFSVESKPTPPVPVNEAVAESVTITFSDGNSQTYRW